MINIIVTFIAVSLASTPLFNEKEIKEVQYLKTSKYLFEKRREELQDYSTLQLTSILKLIAEREQKVLDQKINPKFWKTFDEYTDNQLRTKIIMDLILKDLYEKEGEEDDRKR
ncbi:hypothetical protein [Halobacteriovorax sp.]|uniref:hypothetical protein n=1 Tax=Halobacteriovorax sp. TaxID=2020862 RepID=UPI0035644E02